MKKNRWTGLFVLVVIMLVAASCNLFTPGPGKTAQSFFKAMNEGEVYEAMGYLSIDTIQSLGYDKWRSAFIEGANAMAAKGGMQSMKIINEHIVGDTAQVAFEMEYGNGEIEVDTLELVKENDAWKIVINPWEK